MAVVIGKPSWCAY